MDKENALQYVAQQLDKALLKHPSSMNSPHEGYAVILEELDELWDEVKKQGGGKDAHAAKEAAHVAAMAIRYLMEVISNERD